MYVNAQVLNVVSSQVNVHAQFIDNILLFVVFNVCFELISDTHMLVLCLIEYQMTLNLNIYNELGTILLINI